MHALCCFELGFGFDPATERFFGEIVVPGLYRTLGVVLPLLNVAVFLIDFFCASFSWTSWSRKVTRSCFSSSSISSMSRSISFAGSDSLSTAELRFDLIKFPNRLRMDMFRSVAKLLPDHDPKD